MTSTMTKNKSDICAVPRNRPGPSITDREEASVKKGRSRLLTLKILALVLGFCLIAVVIVSVVLLSQNSESAVPAGTVYPEFTDSFSGLPSGGLQFFSRPEWAAQPSTRPLAELEHPVPYVIISHTATDPCQTQAACTFRVQFTQVFHIEAQNLSDIAYNFLIGGDGGVYVGRGWDFVGAHSRGYNAKGIEISFIGTFDTHVPEKRQLLAAQALIKLGVKDGKIAPDYKLLGHRQVSKILRPEDALYRVIKTWPNWFPTQ